MNVNDPKEATPILNLKRSEYNRGTGLNRLRTWQKRNPQKKIQCSTNENVGTQFEGFLLGNILKEFQSLQAMLQGAEKLIFFSISCKTVIHIRTAKAIIDRKINEFV